MSTGAEMNAARESGDTALTDAAWVRETYRRLGNVMGNVIGTFLRSDASQNWSAALA
jgi:hypothetical protein